MVCTVYKKKDQFIEKELLKLQRREEKTPVRNGAWGVKNTGENSKKGEKSISSAFYIKWSLQKATNFAEKTGFRGGSGGAFSNRRTRTRTQEPRGKGCRSGGRNKQGSAEGLARQPR